MVGKLTPQEARELAGLSDKAFDYYVRIGALGFERGSDGVRYFDRKEMVEFSVRRGQKLGSNGQIAAAVFRAFDERRSFVAIVEDFHLPPDEVRRLWREYTTPIGAPVPSEAELVRRAKARRREEEDERSRERTDLLLLEERTGWKRRRVDK